MIKKSVRLTRLSILSIFALSGFYELGHAATSESEPSELEKVVFPPEIKELKISLFGSATRDVIQTLLSRKKISAPLRIATPSLAAEIILQSSRQEWLDLILNSVGVQWGWKDTVKSTFVAANREGFLSYSQNTAYPRIPYVQEVESSVSMRDLENLIESEQTEFLPPSYSKDLTLDVVGYVQDRFPKALQNWLQKYRVQPYFHFGECDEAIHLHKTKGFTRAYYFMGPKDNELGPYRIVGDPSTHKFRFITCGLRGHDSLTRAKNILGPIFSKRGKAQKAHLLFHRRPSPIITWKEVAFTYQILPNSDRLVIGFQNSIWWQLVQKDSHWQRTELSSKGVNISVFQNQQTGVRVFSAENVYGDEMILLLRELERMGFRRFVYLGTAGGLRQGLQVGDVLVPAQLEFNADSRLNFPNNMNLLLKTSTQKEFLPRRIFFQSRQGWVSDLLQETHQRVRSLSLRGIDGLDIEAVYFADFFTLHPAFEHSMMLIISDLPQGLETFDKETVNREIPMRSLKALLSSIL